MSASRPNNERSPINEQSEKRILRYKPIETEHRITFWSEIGSWARGIWSCWRVSRSFYPAWRRPLPPLRGPSGVDDLGERGLSLSLSLSGQMWMRTPSYTTLRRRFTLFLETIPKRLGAFNSRARWLPDRPTSTRQYTLLKHTIHHRRAEQPRRVDSANFQVLPGNSPWRSRRDLGSLSIRRCTSTDPSFGTRFLVRKLLIDDLYRVHFVVGGETETARERRGCTKQRFVPPRAITRWECSECTANTIPRSRPFECL